jgi:hypothetical protein
MDGAVSNPDYCEEVSACTEARTLCVQFGSSGDDAQTYTDLEGLLTAALSGVSMPEGLEYAGALDPLWRCDEPPSCDLSSPTADDTDGDGEADSADNCPASWNPEQQDFDGDGLGDPCDVCPLAADSEDCETSAEDVDGDGIATVDDNCPYAANEDQADGDGDGKGDVCDECPEVSNPGAAACPTTIESVRDPAAPDHPAEGESVAVSGVVTGIDPETGFTIQDPSEADGYDALYVYDNGDHTVALGDVVTVSGVYTEFYELTELTEISEVTVTASGTPVPDPVTIDDACDIGTGGADAERYESMLVEVVDVTVSSSNPDDPSDYDEFEVNGCLRVDDAFYADLVDAPSVGVEFSRITGIATFAFSNAKVLPRDADDVETAP